MNELICLIHEMKISGRCSYSSDMERTFSDLLKRFEKHAGLTLKSLRDIAILKSPRRAELVNKNSYYQIRSIYEKAVISSSDAQAITELLKLDGVGVPMASAVLAWTCPDRWAVIDVRVLDELGFRGIMKKSQNVTSKDYQEYMIVIRNIARELSWRPQEVDYWLYRHNKERRV